MNLSIDSTCTKSYLARRKEWAWSLLWLSVHPWNIERCLSTFALCRDARGRGRTEYCHKAWFISKGGGHTGLRSASRRRAFGCGANHRMSASTTLFVFLGGLRKGSGSSTPELAPKPLIRTNMMTCCGHSNISAYKTCLLGIALTSKLHALLRYDNYKRKKYALKV